MFIFLVTAAAAAAITAFNAAVGDGDDAPREPGNNSSGDNRNRVRNNVFSVRDRVINDTLGPRDWERQGACESESVLEIAHGSVRRTDRRIIRISTTVTTLSPTLLSGLSR